MPSFWLQRTLVNMTGQLILSTALGSRLLQQHFEGDIEKLVDRATIPGDLEPQGHTLPGVHQKACELPGIMTRIDIADSLSLPEN